MGERRTAADARGVKYSAAVLPNQLNLSLSCSLQTNQENAELLKCIAKIVNAHLAAEYKTYPLASRREAFEGQETGRLRPSRRYSLM